MRSTSLASLFGIILFGSFGLLAGGADPLAISIREGHPGGVTAMAFSADGERFASGAGNGIVRIWDTSLKQLGKREEFKGISITGLAYSPDGRILAASGKGKAGFWHENTLKVEPAPKKGKSSTIFDPELPQASASVFAWTPFPSTDSDVAYSDISITGDGKLIYFLRRSTYHGGVMRYDVLRDVTEERPGPKHTDPRAVASISDPESGATSVYATLEKGEPAILLYGLGEPRTITRGVPPVSKAVTPRIAYSIDGAWLAAWSGSLAIWPVPGSHVIGGDPVTIRDVFAAALGPQGMLATVSTPNEHRNSEITFWRLYPKGQPYGLFGIRLARPVAEVRKLATHASMLQDVSCLAFSPNGRLLAIGGETDGIIRLWDMSFLNGQ